MGGWDPTATITCTDPAGGPAPHVTVDPANRRLTAMLNATRYGALCTITNQRLPTITVSKQSNGGTGSFSISGTNGIDSFSLDTTAANPQISATYPVTAASTETIIVESIPSGWSLSSASCTDGTTLFGTFSGGTLTIPANNRFREKHYSQFHERPQSNATDRTANASVPQSPFTIPTVW